MKAKIKKKEFENALMKENITLKEFSLNAKINTNYLSNLKNSEGIQRNISCGPLIRSKVLKAFGDKYSFDDLFYTV